MYNGGLNRTGCDSRPVAGRWPANVCLDEDAAAMLDEQTGNLSPASVYVRKTDDKGNHIYRDGIGNKKAGQLHHAFGDTGGASRFFYTAKASRREREAGLEGMNKRGRNHVYGDGFSTATKCDLAMGHTPESVAARPTVTNHHPTVKPIALMRWLCRLVTPPGGLILDPFTGSGTTGCAAVLEGFRFHGAELDAEYADIARRRITHWAAHADADAKQPTQLDLAPLADADPPA
jgi:site-specific DNA-methyltransferase (adenine-specific)